MKKTKGDKEPVVWGPVKTKESELYTKFRTANERLIFACAMPGRKDVKELVVTNRKIIMAIGKPESEEAVGLFVYPLKNICYFVTDQVTESNDDLEGTKDTRLIHVYMNNHGAHDAFTCIFTEPIDGEPDYFSLLVETIVANI